MGKKKEKFGPTAQQMIATSDNAVRRSVVPIAFEEQCTSPMKRRQFKHRTDVINGNLSAAQEYSRAFQQKYLKQGWNVITRPVFA